jgi:hypothetical protein
MEPWLTRDKAMIDQLKSIGIEKGKTFSPDAATQDILKRGVAEANAWLVNNYETHYFPPPFYPGGHWFLPASPEVVQGLSAYNGDRELWSRMIARVLAQGGHNPYYLWIMGGG